MASGKPDVLMILLNKLLDDGNVLYKVRPVNVLTDCSLCFIVTVYCCLS